METIAQWLIYTHAAFGGIALICGGVALSTKKGNMLHKKSGKLFYLTMLVSSFFALIISVLPNHISPFLFSIGVFSAYLIISGYRSLRLKKTGINLKPDIILAVIMIFTGLAMVLYPVLLEGGFNIVLLVFGILGIVFGIRDLVMFKNPKMMRKKWLNRHLGNMTGGYIAAVTAFFVVNDIIGGLFNWFLPTVIGSIYISYWINKLNRKAKKKVVSD